MVSGWDVFGLAHRPGQDGERPLAAPAAARPAPATAAFAAAPAQAFASPAPSRDIRVVRGALPSAANDSAGAEGSIRRETHVVSGTPAAASGTGQAAVSRVRGIGSRFRSAPHKTGLARPTEKFR
jgi:type IV secretion system protein VirB6